MCVILAKKADFSKGYFISVTEKNPHRSGDNKG